MSWFKPNRPRWSALGGKLMLAAGVTTCWVVACSMDGRTLTTRADQTRAGARNNDLGGASSAGSTNVAGQKPTAHDAGAAGVDTGGADTDGAGGDPAKGGTASGGSTSGGMPGGGLAAGGLAAGGSQAGTGSAASGEGGQDFGAGGCGDLDHDDQQDCTQTLLQNARFDSAIAPWKADIGTLAQWDARNARAGAGSGALLVRSTVVVAANAGYVQGGSGQCLPATGNVQLAMAARAMIPEGQGEGSAGLNIWFYGADDCADYLLSSEALQATSSPKAWLSLSGIATTPPATRSIYVRLVVSKPFSQPSFEALFDDVLLREQ